MLVWVDCEMTGLDYMNGDKIIEIACIITDDELHIVAQGPCLVLHQPESVLEKMNDWCQVQHRKTGLYDQVLASTMTASKAQDVLLEFIQQHIPTPKTALLAGNTIHMDKAFLQIEFPRLIDYLHYRLVDVSTVKELCRRWYPHITIPAKKEVHRALDDIKESITELEFFRRNIFIKL